LAVALRRRHGQVAGSSAVADSDTIHAVLWQDGQLTDLGPGHGLGINDAGMVVGQRGQTAALWRDGHWIDLGTLGGFYSAALAINNAGVIVGEGLLADDFTGHAMLWHRLQAIDANDFLDDATRAAGWYLNTALSISERGWITGSAINQLTGLAAGYVLRPVPVSADLSRAADAVSATAP
jgi:probable HAF family extracellular repeat protein